MPYVDESNLSQFWDLSKKYIHKRDADGCDWTSVPVNASSYLFEAEPHTPVNPVIEFGFTETSPASGEKSPTNPSTITGVNSVTVTRKGKNLASLQTTKTDRGVTFTANNDGTYTVNGTASSAVAQFFLIFSQENFTVKKGDTFSISGCPAGGSTSGYSVYTSFLDGNNAWQKSAYDIGNGNSIIADEEGHLVFCILVKQGTTVSNLVFKPQIEFGSTVTSFEPPVEAAATVSFGETRYGGTLDVATGKMTVTHIGGKPPLAYVNSVANGIVNFVWNYNGEYKFHGGSLTQTKITCSHFINTTSSGTERIALSGNNDGASWGGVLCISDARIGGSGLTNAEYLANANQWLTDNNVIFATEVWTPFTIDLDPQQLFSALSNSKVNTVFTDTGTIAQLTYAKPMPHQEDVFCYANWQKTETAGAVACCPVPKSDLHPVVNFLFTETLPAEGEKSPTNPSTITGVDSVKVTHGAGNVIGFDVMTVGSSLTSIAVGNADGSFTINGTVPSGGGFLYRKNGTYAQNMELNLESYSTFLPAGTYKIGLLIESGTYTPNSGNCYIRYRTTKELGSGEYIDSDRSYSASETLTSGGTITMPDGGGWYTYLIGCGATASFSNCTIRPYLYVDGADISGDVVQANSYHTLPIGSTRYGGSIDFSTGLMTVTWYGAKLTSASNFRGPFDIAQSGSNKRYIANLPYGAAPYTATNQTCSHYNYNYSFDANIQQEWVSSNGTCYIYDSFATVEELNAFLDSQNTNGTPVVICYQLATPFTVQLTPQQIKALPALDKYSYRVNTLYTDADSIQVGYMKSPIKTEEEFNNAILALGGNL